MRLRILTPLVIAVLAGCATLAERAPADFDVLILNGTVIAHGRTEPAPLDVGIVGDRIASIEADLSGFTAHRVIDASGQLVVPGFIDTHSHADGGGALEEYLLQGVTTVIAGNCGRSGGVGDMADHLDDLEGDLGPNFVTLVGHNTLRRHVELDDAPPTSEQIAGMQALLAEAMEQGAFGLSTGLIYATGFNSSTEEIIALAEVAERMGGVYASHIRGENATVLTAVEEALTIARATGIPTQISHVKAAGPAAWGLSGEFLAMIDEAAAEGLRVHGDAYPYTASQTGIAALFPNWAKNDWDDAIENRRAELERETAELLAGRGGAERVFMVSRPFRHQWLAEAAAEAGKDPVTLLIEDIGPRGGRAVYHQMLEEDVQRFLRHPRVMIGSDGPSDSHPRGHGTFPRAWGHYGREVGLLNPQDLVEKTSTLAAHQFLLDRQRRGRLLPEWHADIAVLDPETIIDGATFEEPTNPPTGVNWVLVNGEIAIANGEPANTSAGRALRLQDSQIPDSIIAQESEPLSPRRSD